MPSGWLKQAGEQLSALSSKVPPRVRANLQISGLGLTKIPLIFFCSPRVVEITDHRVELKIPLTWRTKNHLGAMYFGALAVGADVAGGIMAWRLIAEAGNKVNLQFADFQAEFLKRAEGDVHFACEQGDEIRALVDQAIQSGERESLKVNVLATVPSKLKTEPVARLSLTLSLKKKTSKSRKSAS